MKKWLNQYKEGGSVPNYANGTKYPQVGPADWMNEHGWYAKEGGPYTQGSDPVYAPGYQDYGPMYALPTMGLFEHMPDMSGMNNPANLLQTNYNGFAGGSMGNNIQMPRVQTPTATTNTDSFYEPGTNDYSVDKVRQSEGLMKDGGKAGKGKQLPVKYVDDPHDPRLQAYNDSLGAYNTGKNFQRLSDLYGQHGSYYDTPHKPAGRKHMEGMSFGEENLPENYYSAKGLPIADISRYYNKESQGYRRMMDENIIGNINPEEGMQEVKKWSHAFDKYKVQPESVNVVPDKEAYIFLPQYKKPLQPIQYQHQQEDIQLLPYTGLPTDIPQQQIQGIPSDYFNPQQDHWQSPNVVDGKLVQPAGMYKMQQGGKTISPEDAAISKVLMERNRGKNFVDRAYDPNRQSIQVPGQKGRSTHLMGYEFTDDQNSANVYPQVVESQPGQLQYLGDQGYDHALQTGQYINVPMNKAAMFSDYGYKHASGMYKQQYGGQVKSKWLEKF